MNRDDVTWRGYWPACPTPFTADGSLDTEALRALIEWYLGEGMHGVFVNGTTGEWFSQTTDERRLVAETAIDAARRPRAGRDRLHLAHGEARRSSSASTRSRPAPRASARRRRRTPRRFPTRPSAYFQDISDGVDAPADGLQLAARRRASTSAPTSRAGSPTSTTSSRSRTRTPNLDQFFETTQAGRRAACACSARSWASQGSSSCSSDGGDGFIGGGSLLGPPDGAFWEDVWRGNSSPHARTPSARTTLFPKLWLPGRLGGSLRRLPEPAQGADGAARPAGRHTSAPPAAAGHRHGEHRSRCGRSSSRQGWMSETAEVA